MAHRQDYYAVLGVAKTASAKEIRSAYRARARKHHPDLTHDAATEAKFKEVLEAYEVLSDEQKRQRYDETGAAAPIVIQSKTARYRVEALACPGDVADIYRAVDETNSRTVALKIARSPKNNDLLEAEARTLGTIYPLAQKEERHYRYLPKFYEAFAIDAGARRQVNVLAWLTNFYSLVEVRNAHPTGVALEHAVWMFNRVLEALDFVHYSKKTVHGALTPDHVMVYASDNNTDPYDHGAKLVGWSAAVGPKQSIRVLAQKFEALYPPEVAKKAPATAATDIYMAAKCIVYVLGGDPATDYFPATVPAYLVQFLKGCVLKSIAARPQDAWTLHEELKAHMARHYGPKKYVKFTMPH